MLGAVHSETCNFSIEEKKAAIRDYLIAATAKDCSIMMAFRQADTQEVEQRNNMDRLCAIECSVHLADLDIKPISKLPSHWKLDQDIVRNACKNVA